MACCVHGTTIHLVLLLAFLFLQPFLTDPFSFDITNFNPNAKDMLYEGDAMAVNGAIELVTTSNLGFRVGQASYAEGIYLWDSSTRLGDFTTHFSFTIDNNDSSSFCDGFSFFIAPLSYPFPLNSAGGFLGLFNSTMNQSQHIVVIEFDTYVNRDWDPNVTHVGINIGSVVSVKFSTWDISSVSGKTADAWISYNATAKNLSVFWTYEKEIVYRGNSTLSYIIDLMEVLPQQIKVGFSASTGIFFQRNTISSWQFNSSMDSLSTPSRKDKAKRKKFGVAVGAGAFSLLILALGTGYFEARRRKSSRNGHGDTRVEHTLVENNDFEKGVLPKRFCYRELEMATCSFAYHMRLGQGGSGQVYKGMFSDVGRLVAVKRISPEFFGSEKIFVNEAKIISRLVHRNLVKFIGWCHEQGKFLLVYDYMPNGSLDTHLFGSGLGLPWQVRYKIAVDLASALNYLHEDAEQCVLHRDIKSANVLLDSDFTAKLGDFGVAKLVDPLLRTQITGVVGTFGYLAPEYVSEGRASKRSDMFSFGIVALEIACGRRTYQVGDFHMPLVRWVWHLYRAGNILSAADERLNSNFDRDEMECLLTVGLWCAHPKDMERPKAGQVIKILQLELPLPDLPNDAHDPAFPVAQVPSLQLNSTVSTMSSSLEPR